MSADLDPTPLLERLRAIDSTSLADAGKGLRIVAHEIRPIATGRRLLGRAVTANADGDLMSVIAGLQLAGPGDVLMVAVGSDEPAAAAEPIVTFLPPRVPFTAPPAVIRSRPLSAPPPPIVTVALRLVSTFPLTTTSGTYS